MGWYVKPSPAMDFMHKLGTDPDALAAFKADPHGAMDGAGLSDEHKQVVISNDKEHLLNSILGKASD